MSLAAIAHKKRDETPCSEARDIAASHLRSVRSKLAELQALEASLAAFVATCSTTCASGTVDDCTLFDDLDRGPIANRCG
ncbi:MerR family DNA-binding protein [Altererythrobacter sp. C41]|uniref:MerR family DNA-binding protein n=1 Tax=Altererythrobacter sp. C41 TaxID=2806021 RepID=UPI0019316CFA|nr:MerR family DNA-binding protein [Altererythrobacter sp. C41]